MQALLMSDMLKAKSVFLVKTVFSKIPLIQMTSEDLTLSVPCISERFHTSLWCLKRSQRSVKIKI